MKSTYYLYIALVCLLCSLAIRPAASATDGGANNNNNNNDNGIHHPDGSLRWAILLDLTRSTITPQRFTEALRKHVTAMTAGGKTLFARDPIIVNSGGDLITALAGINNLISKGPTSDTYPDVLFLAETSDVSSSVVDVLRQDINASEILIVSAHSSNARLCDPAMNPRTMCMVPRDNINLRGVLEVVSSQLGWYSMGVVYANSGYGDGVHGMMSSVVQTSVSAPTIVAEVFMNPETTEEEDDALVKQLMKHKTRGVACFLREAQMTRLRAAVKRAGLENSLFLLGSREALNVLPLMIGSYQPMMKAWGALFVSKYTSVDRLISKGFLLPGEGDEFGAYVLSHVLDSMTMIENAGGTDKMSALRSANFTGYTGAVAFDRVYFQRTEATFGLILLEYPITSPLLTWHLKSYAVPALITHYNPTATRAIVPESPLRSITVCMTSPATCADLQMMSAMTFVLMNYNRLTSEEPSKASFLPIAINTGKTGVAGLSALIPVARSCSVLTGPGKSSVAIALSPVINEYKIPQIDYNTADNFFTDLHTYPFFSRTITSNSFMYTALGEVSAHFAWERVIIISTEDQVGDTRAASMAEVMEKRNIYVEKIYKIEDFSRETLTNVLKSIYATDVSRIIHVLLPLTETDAATFFSLADSELPWMHNYVFFLSQELCQHAMTFPEQRNILQSSICIEPFVPAERLDTLNALVEEQTEVTQEIRTILTDGKFLMSDCALDKIPAFAGFAVDAGYTLIDVVERALEKNMSLNQSQTLQPLIHSTNIDKFTGAFSIGANGNRNFAEFHVNIQTPDGVLTIGKWSERTSPAFKKTHTTPIFWMTSSTVVPLDTFRDYSFILGTSVSASPGTIVLSLLGFVVTIAVFFFCYRHYHVQKLIELSLVSNNVPVTEDELKRLRGFVDEV